MGIQQSVASQIAQRLPVLPFGSGHLDPKGVGLDLGLEPNPAGQELQLTESFPIWSLGLDAIQSKSKNVANFARSTGYWHHQIGDGKAAYRYARSKANEQLTDFTVMEVGWSSIAEKVDQSVSWIDSNVATDAEVRMLIVPAYGITAFWLVLPTENDVVVVERPIYDKTLISLCHLYTFDDFVIALSSVPPSIGVPDQ